MRASFFCTSSNSASGRPNWRRVRACSDASRRQVFAAPVQHAPNVVRPKSSTVSATFSPLPGGPRMFSRGTYMSWNASRAVAVPRTPSFSIRGSTTSKSRHVGRDEKRGDGGRVAAFHGRAGHDGQHVRRSPRW